MQRDDIQGEKRPPQSVADYLLKRGGTNIYGEPNFRLVWSSQRMKRQGGRWQDWDKNLSARERGGLISVGGGLLIPSHYKPDRIVVEIRTTPKYRFDPGWVLERWIPAAYYGSETQWNMRCVPGTSVPLGGPWPEFGDYEMCHYSASVEMPSITQLQHAMDRSERAREQARTDVAQMVLERVNEAEEEYQKQLDAEREENEAMIRDVLSPLHSTTLSAGAFRTKLCERAGVFSHNGN
jgi:hypothetical protein